MKPDACTIALCAALLALCACGKAPEDSDAIRSAGAALSASCRLEGNGLLPDTCEGTCSKHQVCFAVDTRCYPADWLCLGSQASHCNCVFDGGPIGDGDGDSGGSGGTPQSCATRDDCAPDAWCIRGKCGPPPFAHHCTPNVPCEAGSCKAVRNNPTTQSGFDIMGACTPQILQLPNVDCFCFDF